MPPIQLAMHFLLCSDVQSTLEALYAPSWWIEGIKALFFQLCCIYNTPVLLRLQIMQSIDTRSLHSNCTLISLQQRGNLVQMGFTIPVPHLGKQHLRVCILLYTNFEPNIGQTEYATQIARYPSICQLRLAEVKEDSSVGHNTCKKEELEC